MKLIKPLFTFIALAAVLVVYGFEPGAANAEAKVATEQHSPQAPDQAAVDHSVPHFEFESSKNQVTAAIEAINLLENYHFSKRPFNDSMSSAFLDAYLQALDPNRLFFTQPDITEFEAFRFKLDDMLKKGQLDKIYLIASRYQSRALKLINASLDNLADVYHGFDFTLDESVLIDRSEAPWSASETEAKDVWRKQLKLSALNLKLADKEETELLKLMRKRLESQQRRISELNSDDIYQVAMNAVAELYDPHTNYLSPRNSENFNINMSLQLEGIGAVLQREDDYTKIVSLVSKGPADKSGILHPSDRIVAVAQGKDGELENIIGWRLDEVVQRIRGPKGTVVRLEIIPYDAVTEADTKIVSIIRDTVKLEEQSAKKSLLEIEHKGENHKVGVIDIPAFYSDFDGRRRGDPDYKSTTRDVKRLITELEKDGVEGLIIDLRNNGGGALNEANDLVGLFIDFGYTVQIKYSNYRPSSHGKVPSSEPYNKMPLTVLVNRMSASASEIFAGAIQDYQRGLILGGQTFGKGTVQSLQGTSHGQLKMTTSKFYRISGESTQHQGVIPDISFPALYNSDDIGESSLDGALPWDTIDGLRHLTYFNLDSILPDLKSRHLARTSTNPDFVYYKERMDWLVEQSAIKTVSLNEKVRRQQRNEIDSQRLAMENKRREAKGLELISIDKLNEDEEKAQDPVENNEGKDSGDEVVADEKSAEKDDDPYLVEAGHILLDMMSLLNSGPSLSFNQPMDLEQ